jgi:two-component system sensor histidine kinase KdpD
MLCFNFFFFPPVGQFHIANPQNWVALFAFLATALVASHLSDRAKKQALEARAHQRETEQLYALSRAILLTEPTQAIGSQAAHHVAQIFDCPAVALYDAKTDEIFNGGPEDLPEVEASLKQVVIQGVSRHEAESDLIVAVVTLGGHPIGSLALKGISVSDGALQALVNLVAIALERIRTEEAASRAEVARQSDEFKSTLLDAIAHEFKTPLTSIKAASTSILSDSASLSPQSRELTTIIDEEADRLSLLVTEAVRMSQIDPGKIQLEKYPLELKELLQRALEHFGPRVEGRSLTLAIGDHLPLVSADPDLLSLALRQLIDNSLKYTPPASPIEITADSQEERVTIRVRDRGSGIPAWERERIFEKFYRRKTGKNPVPGTGLGLHIAREIIRAHGGDLWVEDAAGSGSEFCMTIPVQEDPRKS